MDNDIARWILEFLLRQPISDRVMNSLLSVLPLPKDDYPFCKSVLLRKIFSEVSAGLISEKILEILEMIEELDYREGIRVSDSMQDAYCAVAVECTVSYLRKNSEDCRQYFDAVVRIWRGRILDMERWGHVGLVSDRLMEVREEIEAAVWCVKVREKVLRKYSKNDALESIRIFLKDARERMGLSFLERAAKIINEKGRQVQLLNGNTIVAEQIEERRECLADQLCKVLDANAEKVLNDSNISLDIDTHMEPPQEAGNKQNVPLTPEVSKVKEALRSSAIELQAVVQDPLSNALRIAATITSNLASKEINLDHLGENQNATGEKGAEPVHTKEIDAGNRGAVSRPNIMLRNSSARTYEWDDDSVESSHDGSPNRPRLRTPRMRNLSPLIKQDSKRVFTGRRKKKKWSSLEEQTLRDAVKEHGRGNWKVILENYREIFEERTVVDLKDKWRNMTR